MITAIERFFKHDKYVYIFLALTVFIAYCNIFPNHYTLVDDRGLIRDPVTNFWKSMSSLQLQSIVNTTAYHLFGPNPVPLHVVSIALHSINVCLFFLVTKKLFDRPTALITAVLFAVHPINTESVTWLSGSPYLYAGISFSLSILSYIKFKRTGKSYDFIITLAIFIVSLIFVRTVWIMTIPLVLALIEQTILQKKLHSSRSAVLLTFLVPLIIYLGLYISPESDVRFAKRGIESYVNQQSLQVGMESYPYTIFTMSKQYLLPKDLIIYYDGNPVTPAYYIAMYIGAAMYLGLIGYLWFKNRPAAGILMILLVLLAPTFSPIKITWYLSERYLYYGTGFFSILLAMVILRLTKSVKSTAATALCVSLIGLIYTARTLIRNPDYRDSRTLAAATVKTSPQGFRARNDLGTTYLEAGDYQTALGHYSISLGLLPEGNTAINNSGIIYIQYGLPENPPTAPEPDLNKAKKDFDTAIEFYKKQMYSHAMFYFYRAHLSAPEQLEPIDMMGNVYFQTGQLSWAERMFKQVLSLQPGNSQGYAKLAAVAYRRKRFDHAEQYLQVAMQYDSTNAELKKSMELIKRSQSDQIGPLPSP